MAALAVDLRIIDYHGENAKNFNFPDKEERARLIEYYKSINEFKIRDKNLIKNPVPRQSRKRKSM